MNMQTFIRGNSRIVYLLGYPVAHSLSPQIHNHAFRALGLPYVYIPLGIPPQSFSNAIYTLRASSFAGANVTLPHKGAAYHYCDRISDLSRCTGTVNTLYLENGLLCGTTTDPEGFKRAVAWMGHDLNGSHVVMLGNGGVTRTLSTALALEKKIASLTIMGRNKSKVNELVSEVATVSNFETQACVFDDKCAADILNRCTLLVNGTSAGMHPDVNNTPLQGRCFHKNMTVFDTIYNPSKTRFLHEAQLAGCNIQNGLRMLLYQGLASFKLWTGVDVPEGLFDLTELENMIGK